MRSGIVAMAVLSFMLLPTSVHAYSMSLADVYHPSYGAAWHDSQFNEWLGPIGDVYDGVSWGPLQPGETAEAVFDVRAGQGFGTSDYLYLSAWIDWDQNRTWSLCEEIVNLDDYYFSLGQNLLSVPFQVPATALPGATWMRVRLSFGEDLAPAGGITFGEVEDYQVTTMGSQPIPEPQVLTLLATGGVLVLLMRQRQRRE